MEYLHCANETQNRECLRIKTWITSEFLLNHFLWLQVQYKQMVKARAPSLSLSCFTNQPDWSLLKSTGPFFFRIVPFRQLPFGSRG